MTDTEKELYAQRLKQMEIEFERERMRQREDYEREMVREHQAAARRTAKHEQITQDMLIWQAALREQEAAISLLRNEMAQMATRVVEGEKQAECIRGRIEGLQAALRYLD